MIHVFGNAATPDVKRNPNANSICSLASPTRHSLLRIQLEKFDVAIPDLVAVVLESEIAGPGEVFHGSWLTIQLELVLLSIRTQTRLVVVVAVQFADLLAVQRHADFRPFATNLQCVPFAGGFACVLCRGREIIDGPHFVFANSVSAHHLNLEAGMHGVLQVLDTKEHARIATFIFPADVTLEDEIANRILVNDQVAAGLEGDDRTTLDRRCNRLAIAAFPAGQVFAIEQQADFSESESAFSAASTLRLAVRMAMAETTSEARIGGSSRRQTIGVTPRG